MQYRREDYFKGVDEVMQRLYPGLNDEQRTIKARQMFFDSVIENINKNPSLKNQENVEYFNSLKIKYRLALITTNTKQALEKILSATKLSKLFDIIEASEESEKDDKTAVFDRFIKKYGKPLIYIGGSKKESYDYCKEKGIPMIFMNFENEEELEGTESVNSLEELKDKIDSKL
ncbi:MAG: HAD hydrolase-like protein [Nanoarchaeota archaeon]|nr:HAD hydrolase-like protein [Nanoarchaeota archaeon]